MDKKLFYRSTEFTATDLVYLDGNETKRKFNIHMPFDEFQIEFKNGYWEYTPIRGNKPFENIFLGICDVVAKIYGVNTRKSFKEGKTASVREYSIYALHIDSTYPNAEAVDYFIIVYNQRNYEIRCRLVDKYFYQFPNGNKLSDTEFNEFKGIISDEMLPYK